MEEQPMKITSALEYAKRIQKAIPEDKAEDVRALMGGLIAALGKGQQEGSLTVYNAAVLGTLMVAKGYLNWKYPKSEVQFDLHGLNPLANNIEARFAETAYFSSLEVVANSVERIPLYAVREATGIAHYANKYKLEEVEKMSVALWNFASGRAVTTGQTNVLTEVAKVYLTMPPESLLYKAASEIETAYLADHMPTDPVTYFIRMPHKNGIHYSKVNTFFDYHKH